MIPQSEILEAAKEAGLYMTSPERISAVESLAAIIERKTIERAAVTADEIGDTDNGFGCAAAIRKLGDE